MIKIIWDRDCFPLPKNKPYMHGVYTLCTECVYHKCDTIIGKSVGKSTKNVI